MGEKVGSQDLYKLLDVMNDRLTDLQKNYGVLNESHHKLEMEFTTMKARIDTTCDIVKFFVSPSLAFLILVQLATMCGIIK